MVFILMFQNCRGQSLIIKTVLRISICKSLPLAVEQASFKNLALLLPEMVSLLALGTKKLSQPGRLQTPSIQMALNLSHS